MCILHIYAKYMRILTLMGLVSSWAEGFVYNDNSLVPNPMVGSDHTQTKQGKYL